MKELAGVRRAFAEGLRTKQKIRTETLVSAFATVPRELFVGPPPWSIWDPETAPPVVDGKIPYEVAAGDDPSPLYRDVLVALDVARQLNNGQPSLWAIVYDRAGIERG